MKINIQHICIHAVISGKVQGVYFRSFTQRLAQSLQLTGWVKNLRDGKVETIACGPKKLVTDFITGLHQGPPTAKVSEVCWKEVPLQTFTDFSIHYD